MGQYVVPCFWCELGPAEWKNMARKPLKILRNQGLCGTMNASELWQRAKNTCGWD